MHRDLGCITRLMCLLFTLHGYFFCGDSISDSVIVVVVVVVVAAMAVVDHTCPHDRL